MLGNAHMKKSWLVLVFCLVTCACRASDAREFHGCVERFPLPATTGGLPPSWLNDKSRSDVRAQIQIVGTRSRLKSVLGGSVGLSRMVEATIPEMVWKEECPGKAFWITYQFKIVKRGGRHLPRVVLTGAPEFELEFEERLPLGSGNNNAH